MHWELWDRQSANLVEEFDSEAEALQGVRDMLAVNSPDLIDEISVGAMYDEGEPRDVELPPALYGEALKARLGEMAQEEVAEAAHKVHARIRKWLAEEGWRIQDVSDPASRLNIMVTLPNEEGVNIFQHESQHDCVTIHRHAKLDAPSSNAYLGLPVRDRRYIARSIQRDMTIMGLEFEDSDTWPIEMRYGVFLYFDGLGKDALIQKVYLVLRANALSVRTISEGLEDAGQSHERSSNVVSFRSEPAAPRVAAG